MISDNDVAKIASLARLTLTPEESSRYAAELSRILEYVQQLDSYSVEGVEPLSHVHGASNVFREDTPTPSLPFEGEVSTNAPDKSGRFFRVPLIIE
ncbi:MAG: Asp-tRNA(Asn)/Glu-tRNA(Gln) amidotransferase subunit GatC [Bdellovibrionota bacterium]|nr:MAG: Asp-tRNA(Asn)/Glu-tRNA(Gln) amidotransferase subunit GatC [Bdellovibrionota bacterium]